MSESALARLLRVLDLEADGENRFIGGHERPDSERIYGGQVVAQALRAAGMTVKDRPAHALHGDFLRPGDPSRPIEFHVEALRDGRSFTTRYVRAHQGDHCIFTLTASFHTPEPGFEHQDAMPKVPAPEDTPEDHEVYAAVLDRVPETERWWYSAGKAIELRPVEPLEIIDARPRAATLRTWIRIVGDELPDDPAIHQCLFAYASDFTLLDTVGMPHGISWLSDQASASSLDHALWFHRPFRMDDWLLYDQSSPRAAEGRGFTLGHLYDRGGSLVATATQEGLMRLNASGLARLQGDTPAL